MKLFPPKFLCGTTCLKLQLLYFVFRDILQLASITIDQLRGLYIFHEITNSIYATENTMRDIADTIISEFKQVTNSRSAADVSSNLGGGGNRSSISDTELF